MTIDIKNYAGEIETPAAVEPQPINSYARNEYEYPVLPPEAIAANEAVAAQTAPEPVAAPVQQEDPQALNFRALSESVERLKAERELEKREHQLQLDMLRVNQMQRQPEAQPKKMFEGMEDNDIPNVGELRKAWNERESAYNEKIEELQVANKYPDYAEVLAKHGKQLAETDPAFIQGLRGAENKALFAYQYTKMYAERNAQAQRIQELEAQLKAPAPQPQKSNDAQRIVANARKPGTLAQAGGQSALSQADYFETMSDADFMKFASKHLEAI